MIHAGLALAAAIVWLSASAPIAGTQNQKPADRTRASEARAIDIYVSAVNAKGEPVQGLTAADVTVREDGIAREVLKVAPATEPMHVALVVDDSQAATDAVPHLREGLTAFIEALRGKAQIAVVTVGERPTSLAQYTSSPEELKKAVTRIFSRQGTGAYLIEGIHDVSRGLQKREAPRPVIVAVTMEGVEFSNLQAERVLEMLEASGATLHVLAIGTPSSAMTDEWRNRNLLIAEGTSRTGGRRDQLLSPQALPDRLKQIAAELANQYVVTYSRPETLIPPEQVRVGTTRPDVTVRARTRAAERR